MQVGKYTYGTQHIRIIWSEGKTLKIGSFCSIANDCVIMMGGDHRVRSITTFPFGHLHRDKFPNAKGIGHPASKGPVEIGNDVWIAGNVTIMAGVKVGDGAIIAKNSHVVKDVEPYSIVGGNPAKLIRYRYTPEQIAKLLEIKWWTWPDEKINSIVHLLEGEDIEAFLEACSAFKTSN